MSNNIQKIIEYAKDPSCIMCVTPSFGCAWHSTIRDQYQSRNFVAAKTIIWDNFITFFKSIGMNDFYFRLKFHINQYTSNSFLFQNDASAQIYMGCWSSNSASTQLLSATKITNTPITVSLIPDDSPDFLGGHVLEIERRDGTAKITFDGVIKSSVSGQTNIDCSLLDGVLYPFRTKYAVSFSEIYLEDLIATTSYTVPHDVLWQSNPQPVLPPVAGDSIAQRLGLLAKYNCDTSNLDFRLASTAQNNWYVKTGLNFAGWSRPLTIIGRMYIAPDNGGSSGLDYDTGTIHPMLAQGWPVSTDYAQSVLTVVYNNTNNSNRYLCKFSAQSNVQLSFALDHDPRGTVVTIALTVDPATGEYKFYENGVLRFSGINSALIGFVLRSDTSHVNNDANAHLHQRIDSYQNRNDRVDWCMAYDRVLNDAEIKFYST